MSRPLFPKFDKKANKENLVERFNELTEFINQRYAFQLEQQFSAIDRQLGKSGTTSITQNFISGSGGSTVVPNQKTRVVTQSVSGQGYVSVIFAVPLTRTDYSVTTYLFDTSGNKIDSYPQMNTRGLGGLSVYCTDGGTLVATLIEP